MKEGTICSKCGKFVPPEIPVHAIPGEEVQDEKLGVGNVMVFLCKECYDKREDKKIDNDYTTCPDCDCDEALILARGIKENIGKTKIFCPVCDKVKIVKNGETLSEHDLEAREL